MDPTRRAEGAVPAAPRRIVRRRWVAGAVVVVVLALAWSLLARPRNAEFLFFPGGNARDTYASLHGLQAAQAIATGRGVKVGVLDHSFAMSKHPSLYAGGRNFVPGDESFLTEREWHGYWMATLVHDVAPEAQIYALNTYAFSGEDARADAMVRAIDWAIEQHLDVLSYSAAAFEGGARTRLEAALRRAHQAGIVTVFLHTTEAGNILPAGLSENWEDAREPDVNVLHFDYRLLSLDRYRQATREGRSPDAGFLSLSSTAAVVAGVAALMRGVDPTLSPERCRTLLRQTARPMEFQGRKPPRVLDAVAAVRAAKEPRPEDSRLTPG